MNIQIFGEIELLEYIKKGESPYSHLISIRNKKSFMNPLETEIINSFNKKLFLEFHDIENREWMPPGTKNIPIPEIEHIEKIIKFVNQSKYDPDFTGFTIHCWRGISRSTAVALGIAYIYLKSERKALNYIMKIRPTARPLNRIIELWDQTLNSNLKKETDKIRKKWTSFEVNNALEYLENSIEELDSID